MSGGSSIGPWYRAELQNAGSANAFADMYLPAQVNTPNGAIPVKTGELLGVSIALEPPPLSGTETYAVQVSINGVPVTQVFTLEGSAGQQFAFFYFTTPPTTNDGDIINVGDNQSGLGASTATARVWVWGYW